MVVHYMAQKCCGDHLSVVSKNVSLPQAARTSLSFFEWWAEKLHFVKFFKHILLIFYTEFV